MEVTIKISEQDFAALVMQLQEQQEGSKAMPAQSTKENASDILEKYKKILKEGIASAQHSGT